MTSVLEKKSQELDEQIEHVRELNEQLERALEIFRQNPNVVDGVQLASELGRLDFASALFAITSFAYIISGLFAFSYFKAQTSVIAKKTAEEVAEEIAERRLTNLFKDIEARMVDLNRFADDISSTSSAPGTEGAAKAKQEGEFKNES